MPCCWRTAIALDGVYEVAPTDGVTMFHLLGGGNSDPNTESHQLPVDAGPRDHIGGRWLALGSGGAALARCLSPIGATLCAGRVRDDRRQPAAHVAWAWRTLQRRQHGVLRHVLARLESAIGCPAS
ncbi:MAG: hypothetical protein AAF628_15855 [Planctomycetota bacterium]